MGLGQHSAPTHVLAHLSDTHLLADGATLATIDTRERLVEALSRLESAVPHADVVVVSGDVTDLGEPGAYELARALIEPVAQRLGATLVWAAGNHDERVAMWSSLCGAARTAPFDSTVEVHGLRVISLDTSIPGYHHGGFDDGQAAWLADQLAEPAPHGTVLVMHHPPLPYRAQIMRVLEFRDEPELAQILRGSDVRLILSGHLHVNGSGTFAGVPVVLASATSYADDLAAGPTAFAGIDAEQSVNVIELLPDSIAHSVVPARAHPQYAPLPVDLYEQLVPLSDAERLARFSKKPG